MIEKLLTIGEAARMLQVSIDTLRRWDEKDVLKSFRLTPSSPRRYREDDLFQFLTKGDLINLARTWESAKIPIPLSKIYYCHTRDVFQARLATFQTYLSQAPKLENISPIIVAITGEIGNNSFDHNAGNWPDEPGIFFGYNLDQSQIILADRGYGILKTLKRVRPHLKNHGEALKTAFTEVISGRAPEARGNGLKFVRKMIVNSSFNLLFQTGDAILYLQEGDSDLNITHTKNSMRGCFAAINY